MHNALRQLEQLPKHIDEALQNTQKEVMKAVVDAVEGKIHQLEKNRDKRDYSSLGDNKIKDKLIKNCNKKCGDEGVYHQVQILEELVKHLKKGMKK